MKKILLFLFLALFMQSVSGKLKTFAVYGNSISTYPDYIPVGYKCYYNAERLASVNETWWMQLSQMSNMKFIANASWSGSTVSSNDGTADSHFTSNLRVNDVGRNGIPQVIIIAGGVNDWWRQNGACKLGEYQSANFDSTTFRGAYAYMLYKLKKKYPKTTIVCCSIFPNRRALTEKNRFGWTMMEGNKSIAKIAKDFGAYYVDVTDCGISEDVKGNTVDGLHPNKKGMVMVAKTICKSLISQKVIKKK